jgi:uncharacterized coiled-coil DUF342 family protein
MPVMLERWNDDKMDALSGKVDGLGEQMREQRQEMREWRKEMKASVDRVDDRLDELRKETKEGFEAIHRTMNRNVIALCGIFIAALVALAGLVG